MVDEGKAFISYPRHGTTIRVDLEANRVIFGRARSCHEVLPLKGVSREHFRIERDGNAWFVEDLKSTNGTYVNQRLVQQRQQLWDGDRLTMGPPGLVPVVLTVHLPVIRSRDDEPLPADIWDDPEPPPRPAPPKGAGVYTPGPVRGPLQQPVLDIRGNSLFDEEDESSIPSVNASINVADYERQIGTVRRAEPVDEFRGSEKSILGKLKAGKDEEGPRSGSGFADSALIIGLFSRMGHALLKSASTDDMLDTVLNLVFDELPADRGSIWLVDEDQGTISARAVQNKNPETGSRNSISRTIVNEAVRSKQSLLVSNPVEQFGASKSIEVGNIRSAMCAPLYLEGRVLGFVYVDTISSWIVFTQQHLEMLTAVAIFAAVGVEKWRIQELADRERCRREEVRLRVEALQDVAASLSSHLDTGRLVETIIVRARELLDADRGSVFLIDKESETLHTSFAEGVEGSIRISIHEGLVGYVARTGNLLNVPDAAQDSRFKPEIDSQTGYQTKSVLSVPMRSQNGDIIAVAQLVNKQTGVFTRDDEELFQAFCGQAAVALENAMLFNEAVEMRGYLESILQSISQLVLTLDEEGRLVRSNRPAEKLLGVDEAILRRQPYTEWFDGRNESLVENIGRVYQDPTPVYVADDDLVLGQRTISFNYNIVPLRDHDGHQTGVVVVLEDITQRKRAMTTLGRYMSPVLAQKVLDEGGDRLGGVRQDVTVLFSDIRGYTALTEALDAARVVEILNAYFSLMVDGVLAENGLLDKYIGDALMAVFGVPFVRDDDAERACRAALRMRRALTEFNRWLGESGLKGVGIGIGVSSGTVITGNIGSERRLEYTCIGDSVNVASRLEGVTKAYGVTIVLSEFTRRQLPDDFLVRELDMVRVAGKQKPIRVYELIGDVNDDVDPRLLRVLPHYRVGLDEYRRGRWQQARQEFQKALDLADDPPSRLFLRRCEQMQRQPVNDSWDGVWDLSEK